MNRTLFSKTFLRQNHHFSTSAVPLRVHQIDLANLSMKGAPVVHSRYPGTRVLKLGLPAVGNYLTKQTLDLLARKTALYDESPIVAITMFNSQSNDLFSQGLSSEDSETLVAAHSFSNLLKKSRKGNPLTVFSGEVSGTAYATFANSKYRMGTESTRFNLSNSVNPLNSARQFPLCGLGYHMSRSCEEGLAIARYLATTQKTIGADTMYSMGLLTHIVEEGVEDSLSMCVAHSVSDDQSKSNQNPGIFMVGGNLSGFNEDPLVDLLDALHIGDTLNGDEIPDPMDDPSWGQFLAITPPPLDWDSLETEERVYQDGKKFIAAQQVHKQLDPNWSSPVGMKNLAHLDGDFNIKHNISHIHACFSADSPSATKSLLNDLINTFESESASGPLSNSSERGLRWAKETLHYLDNTEDRRLKVWYDLTKLGQSAELEEVYQAELNLIQVGF